MRALIVVESIFGNTSKVADAVAEGLADRFRVDVVAVGDAAAVVDDGVDLLVVGGPTHIWGLSRPNSRRGAVQQQPELAASLDVGIREWLTSLVAPDKVAAAAFDTRLNKPRLITGSAARAAAKQLRHRGARVIAVESFLVAGTPGPLCDGELDRARRWGAGLGQTLASSRH